MTNVIGIVEAEKWEQRDRHWLWCVWHNQQNLETCTDEPSEFGFTNSRKDAERAAWDTLRRLLGHPRRFGATYKPEWAISQLEENHTIQAELKRLRDERREYEQRPKFSRCSIGKNRWYWVAGCEYDFGANSYTKPLAEGIAESALAALAAAESQVGPVRPQNNWVVKGYREMLSAENRRQQSTDKKTTSINEFAYQCSGGFSEPHRIVKRTAKYVSVEQEPVHRKPTGEWYDYVTKNFVLDREEFERTGKAMRRGQWYDTYYADPEIYLAERRISALPDCFVRLELDAEATSVDVKKAYKRLAKKHHPDAGGDADEFKDVRAAYEKALEIVKEKQGH